MDNFTLNIIIVTIDVVVHLMLQLENTGIVKKPISLKKLYKLN